MRIEPCKICANQDFEYLYQGCDRLHYLPGEFKLYRCSGCGLILVYPQLRDQELSKYYPQDYYSYENSHRVAPPRSLKEKLVYFLLHPFQALNCLFYSKLLGQNRDLKCGLGSRVLDIGCGDGRYLLEKRSLGCQCFGNDIGEKALNRLREKVPEIETRCGNLWDVDFSQNFFDVINMSHVIEHVRDMDKLLIEARRIVKDDGLLRIQVPNAASVSFAIFGKFWMPLDVPRHVYTFSFPNLKRMFRDNGFEIVHARTVEGSFSVIGSIFYVVASLFKKEIPLMRHERIWDSEIIKLLFFPYAFVVNLLRVGDTAEFILRKAAK
jgi:SAM-dependent methyltransferase